MRSFVRRPGVRGAVLHVAVHVTVGVNVATMDADIDGSSYGWAPSDRFVLPDIRDAAGRQNVTITLSSLARRRDVAHRRRHGRPVADAPARTALTDVGEIIEIRRRRRAQTRPLDHATAMGFGGGFLAFAAVCAVRASDRDRNRAEHLTVEVLMADVDHLTRVNDTFGHDAGDDLLQAFAAVRREAAPAGAVVARIGGDEFGILRVGPGRALDDLALAVRGPRSPTAPSPAAPRCRPRSVWPAARPKRRSATPCATPTSGSWPTSSTAASPAEPGRDNPARRATTSDGSGSRGLRRSGAPWAGRACARPGCCAGSGWNPSRSTPAGRPGSG